MDRAGFEGWLTLYERLWRTPGTAGLVEAFSQDVVYSQGPYEQEVRGLAAVAELWEAERVSAEEEFSFEASVVAFEGDTGVARVDVRYLAPGGNEYKDLWVARFDADGRCSSFEEWPFWPGRGPIPSIGD